MTEYTTVIIENIQFISLYTGIITIIYSLISFVYLNSVLAEKSLNKNKDIYINYLNECMNKIKDRRNKITLKLFVRNIDKNIIYTSIDKHYPILSKVGRSRHLNLLIYNILAVFIVALGLKPKNIYSNNEQGKCNEKSCDILSFLNNDDPNNKLILNCIAYLMQLTSFQAGLAGILFRRNILKLYIEKLTIENPSDVIFNENAYYLLGESLKQATSFDQKRNYLTPTNT